MNVFDYFPCVVFIGNVIYSWKLGAFMLFFLIFFRGWGGGGLVEQSNDFVWEVARSSSVSIK